MHEQVVHIDAYTAAEMAQRMETVGISKGNLVGGTIMVAGVYWIVYLRRPPKDHVNPHQ